MSKVLEYLKEYYEQGLNIGGFDEKDQEMFECCLKELKALEELKKYAVICHDDIYLTCDQNVYIDDRPLLSKNTNEELYDLLKEVLL